jgi:hypothetical protein
MRVILLGSGQGRSAKALGFGTFFLARSLQDDTEREFEITMLHLA